MPIDRVSASQFAERIRTAMLSRDVNFDTTEEVADIAIDPQATVFELQRTDLRQVNLMLTLADPTAFDGVYAADLDNIIFNEGMTSTGDSFASTTLVFERSAAPASDIPVQRGYPVATVVDETTGITITFVATEETVMRAASASSYFNLETQRYELSVPVSCVISGETGNVGVGRITRPLRPLAGFSSVTNRVAATGGRDVESNQRKIDRYLIAVIGREISTSNGAKKVILDDNPEVAQVLIVSGTSELLTRADETAGAVDAYLRGAESTEITENPRFLGAGQLIKISTPPIVTVTNVRDLSTGTTFVEGTDFDVVYDETGVASSARAVEGIRFRFTGAAPTIGNPVTVTYTYNSLVRRLQSAFSTDDVHGRDLLFKAATEVPIVHSALLRVLPGFNRTTVRNAVRAAVLALINTSTELGADIEISDIQGVVRAISGVDNYKITLLAKASTPSGIDDVAIEDSEFGTLDEADYLVDFF